MKVIGFAGYSGAGKTTLVERLIPALKLRGLRVSVVKHAHHKFDIDHPGKDTYRHREAGAFEVVVASDRRLALMREFEQPAELDRAPPDGRAVRRRRLGAGRGLQAQRPAQDRGLARAEAGEPARYPDDDFIVAIATDAPDRLPQPTLRPVLDLNDADAHRAVAGRQWRSLRLRRRRATHDTHAPAPAAARRSTRPGRRLLAARAARWRARESVSTFEADGRVLAQDLVSALQVPPQDNSSMDGYAVRSAEIADAGVPLPVSQRIPAGTAAQPLAAGHARRASSPARRCPRAPTRS